MSVAFRRESDEEHKEPKFEIPIPAGPNLVTRRGLALIEARVAQIEAAIGETAEETAGETAGETGREALKRDLRYWQTRRATALPAPPPPAGEAAFGTRVRFRLDGEVRSIDIVGDDEAEPAAGRIAFSAPLARALIGAGAGDLADLPGRPEAIEILDVSPIED